METSTLPAPSGSPAPSAPAMQPVDTAAAPTMPEMDDFHGGTDRGGKFGGLSDAFKSLNIVEIAFGILGATALFYTIYYYRFKMMANKADNTEIQNRLDDIAIKVADLQSATQRDELLGNPQQGFDGMFY